MKAITLRHPWPYAIAHLGKTIENRRWFPSYLQLKIGDRLAIHGGVYPKGINLIEAISDLQWIADNIAPEVLPIPIQEIFIPGIVAIATYMGTTKKSDSPWFAGPIGWKLEDTFALPEPIACKGAQGLWEVPAEVVEEIRKQWVRVRWEKGRKGAVA